MSDPTLNRRDLTRLALAALGGLASGLLVGCGASPSTGTTAADNKEKDKDKTASADDTPPLLHDPHICRGINTCKNRGKTGTMNECAGQGHCATAKSHSCDGQNDCKGQGGCGEHPGENKCKGQGACQVPMKPKTWKIARAHFEDLMKKADKKFGDAPES